MNLFVQDYDKAALEAKQLEDELNCMVFHDTFEAPKDDLLNKMMIIIENYGY